MHDLIFNQTKLGDYIDIEILWGISDIDNTGTDHFEPFFFGSIILDENLK